MQTLRAADATLIGKFAKIDAEANAALAALHGVTPTKGYPALYWYADGEATAYRGGRAADDLLDFVLTRGGPLVKELPNSTAIEAFKLSFPITVVATMPAAATAADSHAVASLEAACRATAVRCGRTSSEREEETTSSSTATLFRAVDDASVSYPGRLDADAFGLLERFVVANTLPPVVAFGATTQKAVFESRIDAIVYLFLPRTPTAATAAAVAADTSMDEGAAVAATGWAAAFAAAALSFRGEAIFTSIEPSSLQNHQMEAFYGQPLAFFGLGEKSGATLPAIALYRKAKNARYVFRRHDGGEGSDGDQGRLLLPPTEQELSSFVRRAIASELTPFQRSEPPPPSRGTDDPPKDGKVLTLVGATYADIVLGRRDVLVHYHAPWCVACKQVVGKSMASLAAKRSGDAGVMLAQIDVSLNDVAAPAIQALPAVHLFRADAHSLDDSVALASLLPKGHDVEETVGALDAFLERERATDANGECVAGERDS